MGLGLPIPFILLNKIRMAAEYIHGVWYSNVKLSWQGKMEVEQSI